MKLDYRPRWDQSAIDFLNEVADDLGGTVKPTGGKVVALKRGAGKTDTGRDLSPILIRRRRGFSYDIDIEPRSERASWQDGQTGRRKLAKVKTGRDGPIVMLPHPYRSEIEARQAAQANAHERRHTSSSGTFESPSLPHARAEAPVIASGFGGFIDGRWKAETVEKIITVSGGFLTMMTVGAGEEAKGRKGK